MKLTDFIVEQAVIPNLESRDRDGALRELAGSLAAAGAIDESNLEDLVKALIKREENGTTGFGKGVAVPHAKSKKVQNMVGTVGRSAEGLDFFSVDKQPVYTIVMLLSPESEPQMHLQAMNIVFSSLQQDQFRKFLRQSETREQIVDLLEEQSK